MFDRLKTLFKKKEETTLPPPPHIQLQMRYRNGSWINIDEKKETREGKTPPNYRQIITLHDGRVEINDNV